MFILSSFFIDWLLSTKNRSWVILYLQHYTLDLFQYYLRLVHACRLLSYTPTNRHNNICIQFLIAHNIIIHTIHYLFFGLPLFLYNLRIFIKYSASLKTLNSHPTALNVLILDKRLHLNFTSFLIRDRIGYLTIIFDISRPVLTRCPATPASHHKARHLHTWSPRPRLKWGKAEC